MNTIEEMLFLRVVESGSLKEAAALEGMDASTVSRRIAALEAKLGVELLRRSTRGSTPTQAGARYYQGMRALVEQKNALEADVSGRTDIPHGHLRVTAPAEFGARFVVPVAARLQERAPELEIELILGSRFFDVVERGIDVAVRIGRLRDSSLRARRLGAVPRVVVAAPAYLERVGRPQSAQEISGHDFIFYARGNAGASIPWRGPDGPQEVEMSGRMTVNSISAIRALVLDGRGIHYGPQWAFARDLEEGRLEALFPELTLPSYPLHALYAPSSYVPAKTRAFIDAMLAEVRDASGLEPR